MKKKAAPKTKPAVTLDLTQMSEKKARLESIKRELKEELFGIDEVIDKVIDSIRTWYLIPEVITYPVIINLFGLTGTGKTQLVRSLVKKLKFNNRYVEIPMDADSRSWGPSKLADIIQSSSIREGEPGIVFLDEFQRFRTMDGGEEVKVEKYQDIWQLLSDGRFYIDYTYYETLMMDIAYSKYQIDQDADDDDDAPPTKKRGGKKDDNRWERKYHVYPYEAQKLKRMFKLKEPLEEVMTWTVDEILQLRCDFLKDEKANDFVDYTKCLIFICGNLDEALYISKGVNDCDTDADTFYEMSRTINVNDIKSALHERFRPEQIARLGNNIIIYPSLSKKTYERIIEHHCGGYLAAVERLAGIRFTPDQSVFNAIYANSVYPTQGTRPVFSSIHKIFTGPLSDCVLWALESGADKLTLAIDSLRKVLVCSDGVGGVCEISVDLELDAIKAKNSLDLKSLVAVHEAGHAVVYTVLNRMCPLEININLSSFTGGYTLGKKRTVETKKDILNTMMIYLAGLVAEEEAFGSDFRSCACEVDITTATRIASKYVRRWAFDGNVATMLDENECNFYRNEWQESNAVIDGLLKEARDQARAILTANREFWKETINLLLGSTKQNKDTYHSLASQYVPDLATEERDVTARYNELIKLL